MRGDWYIPGLLSDYFMLGMWVCLLLAGLGLWCADIIQFEEDQIQLALAEEDPVYWPAQLGLADWEITEKGIKEGKHLIQWTIPTEKGDVYYWATVHPAFYEIVHIGDRLDLYSSPPDIYRRSR